MSNLWNIRRKNNCSKSEAIESLLKIYLGLDNKAMQVIERWAIKEKRTIEQQAQLILESAANDWAKKNLKHD